MCLHPITLPNPYFDGSNAPIDQLPRGEDLLTSRVFSKGKDSFAKYKHDRTSSTIQVPCGKCMQCVSMRQAWFNQRVQMESFRSHLFFFTLTYNDRIRFTNIKDYNIPYPHYDHVQHMFKHLRNDGFKFRYWIVSEYGTRRKRPHYHGILALDKSQGDYKLLEAQWYKRLFEYWSENVGSRKYPDYKPLSDLHIRGKKRTYDFHYIEPILNHDNDVSFYISKYIMKYDTRIEKLLQKITLDPSLTDEETAQLRSMIKPRSIMSKDFGSYKDIPEAKLYISKCLRADIDLPQFFDVYTGQSSLLSPYYRKFIPAEWYIDRFNRLSVSDYEFRIESDETVFESGLNHERAWNLVLQHKRNKEYCESKYID